MAKMLGEEQVFKIRRKSDGKYAVGGWWTDKHSFNSKGKIWTTKSGLSNHLQGVAKYNPEDKWPYHDCEIVTYVRVMVEEEASSCPVPIPDMSR